MVEWRNKKKKKKKKSKMFISFEINSLHIIIAIFLSLTLAS